jgi:hypothetical protein
MKAAERDVVGAFADQSLRAREIVVAGNADEHRLAACRAGAADIAIVFAQVHARGADVAGQRDVVIDDEQSAPAVA